MNLYIIQQLFSYPCRKKKSGLSISQYFKGQAKTHIFFYNPVASFLKEIYIIEFCTLMNSKIKATQKQSFNIQIGQDLSIT